MASKVALQLYTVRDLLKTPEQAEETLRKVRQIGYNAVEHSGVASLAPQRLRDLLHELGLETVSVHVSYDELTPGTGKAEDRCAMYGCKEVSLSSMPHERFRSYPELRKEAARLTEIGKKLASKGLRFSYHSHWFEYERLSEGVGLEILYRETDPKFVKSQLDICWAQYAGADPARWIRNLKGRVPTVHAKDLGVKDGKQMTLEVGEGNINWPNVLDACKEAGVEWYIVEQDSCWRSPLDSVAVSLANLNKMGIQ